MKARALKSKIATPKAAAAKCRKLRASRKKVVFTNGCFDILHPGHVSYLERARAKGDFLVVALDTDESVRFLKGDGRPVNSLDKRLQVVAALESVDLVTWFEKSNPVPLIEKMQPSVLVKGGDWKPSHILGASSVLSWGGKVYSISFVKGNSTTKIIEKISKGDASE